jgi:hypothetical protein
MPARPTQSSHAHQLPHHPAVLPPPVAPLPQIQAPKSGGILSRLRNAGRRIASASAAASSALKAATAGSSSGRSLFSGLGGRTVKLGPKDAPPGGPVGEGAEGAEAAAPSRQAPPLGDAPRVVVGGAADAGAARAALRRRRGQGGAPGPPREAWGAPGGPQHGAQLAALTLGAPPPPFFFPEAVASSSPLGAPAGAGAAAAGERPVTAPEASSASWASLAAVGAAPFEDAGALGAAKQAGTQLLGMLVSHQRAREARQARLEARAVGVRAWLSPAAWWHGGPAGSRGGQAATAAAAHVAAVDEDGTYSWHEFHQTLSLIGLDLQGRLLGPKDDPSSGSGRGSRSGAGASGAWGRALGEGAEGAGSAPARTRARLGPAPSFGADLDSLIAEAEAVTSAAPASPGVTFAPSRAPTLPAPLSLEDGCVLAPPLPGQPRARSTLAAPGEADARCASAAVPWSEPGGRVVGALPPTPHVAWQRLGDAPDGPVVPHLPLPLPPGSVPCSSSGGVSGGGGLATPGSGGSAAGRFRTPRSGRVTFMPEGGTPRAAGSNAGVDAAATAAPAAPPPAVAAAASPHAPLDVFGAALASLGPAPSDGRGRAALASAGGQAAGAAPAAKGVGWGGVRFSDSPTPGAGASAAPGGARSPLGALGLGVLVAASRKGPLVASSSSYDPGTPTTRLLPHTPIPDALLAGDGDDALVIAMREPSITVKALRRKRELAAAVRRARGVPGQPACCSASTPSRHTPFHPASCCLHTHTPPGRGRGRQGRAAAAPR